jgi:PAS domain S-box-containing protein
MTKLNLLSLGIVLVMTGSVLAVGLVIISDILYGFQERVLRLELTNAGQVIVQRLGRSGVRAAAQAAADLQDQLRRRDDLKSARLFIVEAPDNRVVYHPDLQAGEKADFAFVYEMSERTDGSIEYTRGEVSHFAVFTTVYPVKWLIVLSITKEQMLEKKAIFLRATGGVTFLVLCLNALVVSLFGRRLVRRIRTALDCVALIEKGELSARISSIIQRDEVGHLQGGINAMSARIQQRTLEQQAAESAVREREARIRRLVESNIIGVFFWDLNGAISEANDHFLALVGYGRDDLASGKISWASMTPPEYLAADSRAIKELEAAGTCRPYQKHFIRKDGSRIPVLVGGAFLAESRNQGVAYVLDLTEREQAEAERQARHTAEAANRAKSEFLASMSHELRTPLNAVLGYTQVLQREPGLSERQAVALSTIQQSGQHLLTLINELLDLARIEAGKLELHPVAMDLAGFLRGVAAIIRVRMEEKGLLFVHEPPAESLTVLADEKRLRQVLLNLLSNAASCTDRGHVRLEVRILAREAGGVRLRFEVADTGVGIAADRLAAIFEPFEQVGEVGRRAGGTGLGLSISRRLLRLMGSEIRVESQLGVGSRFSFDVSFPLAEAADAVPSVVHKVAGYAGSRRTVLIADDVTASRTELADLLGGLGFDVSSTANGQEAVEQARACRPDLLVADLVMPAIDGLETIRRIRSSPGLVELPILAMSASAHLEDQAAALAAGADAFLAKPIDREDLLRHTARLLGLAWNHDQPVAKADGEGLPLVIPPSEEMAVLHEIALAGNMRAVHQRATQLVALDGRYRPFADELHRLAQGYQSKAIRALVEAHLRRDEREE